MEDYTIIAATCPACKSKLKVRVDIDFDAELDLECTSTRSYEALVFPSEHDEEGNVKKPDSTAPKYEAMIPNVEVFGVSPEGFAIVEGEKRPCFCCGHEFILDRVPFRFVPDEIFKGTEDKDWTEGTIKQQIDPTKGPFRDVIPSETGNAIVAMRFDNGEEEVDCYLPRNSVDLFCTAYPGCTFHHQFGSQTCVIVRDMDTGKVVGGIMPMRG